MFTAVKLNFLKILFFVLLSVKSFSQEKVIGIVENDADSKPISNVHVINLNKVVGVITDKSGSFEIDADVNDTLYFSYLGFKSIKIGFFLSQRSKHFFTSSIETAHTEQ